jgi:restriction system protein
MEAQMTAHPTWRLLNMPVEMTAEEFEQYVAQDLAQLGIALHNFQVQRLETIQGSDGEYEIDVPARFEALGANFLVLVECKHHKHPIKREVVQVLFDRLRAVGGHKGILYATAPFQRGAIEYAQLHGITLIQVADGRANYGVKAGDIPPVLPPWVPRFVSLKRTITAEGHEQFQQLVANDPMTLLGDWLS